MSRASAAGNSVMKAVEDVCGLFGVPAIRMQSRTFMVPGVGGRERPFFVGEWTDALGVKRRKGMADMLLQPRVNITYEANFKGAKVKIPLSFTVPLWCECKAGSGTLSSDQQAFREWVLSIGAAHICVTDSCEQLMEWFRAKNVEKP